MYMGVLNLELFESLHEASAFPNSRIPEFPLEISYRFLPTPTEFYQFLPIPTDSYRFLPFLQIFLLNSYIFNHPICEAPTILDCCRG